MFPSPFPILRFLLPLPSYYPPTSPAPPTFLSTFPPASSPKPLSNCASPLFFSLRPCSRLSPAVLFPSFHHLFSHRFPSSTYPSCVPSPIPPNSAQLPIRLLPIFGIPLYFLVRLAFPFPSCLPRIPLAGTNFGEIRSFKT